MNIIEQVMVRFGYKKEPTTRMKPSAENLAMLQDMIAGAGAGQGFGFGGEDDASWLTLCNNYKYWIYTCVDKKAKTIAGLPFGVFAYKSKVSSKFINARPVKHYIKQKNMNVYERKLFLKQENMERVQLTDHPLVNLLRKPNEKDVRFTFIETIIQHLELCGSCGIWKVRNGIGVPVELWTLPLTKNGNFKPVPGTDRLIGSYLYSEGQKTTTFKPEDIIWPYYPDPKSPFQGMSAVKAQTLPYDINLYLLQQQYYFLKNGATSANVFTTDNDRLTDKQVTDLKALIKSQYEDIKKRGKAMFLHSGLKQDKPFGFATKDLIPAQIERLVRDMQLSAFDMPAGKLGLVEDVNRASLDAINDMYMAESIRFTTMLLEEFLEEYLCPEFDDRLTLDFELPFPNERDTDLKERELNVRNAITTINEERAKMDKDPVAWGDEPPPAWVGGGMQQGFFPEVGAKALGEKFKCECIKCGYKQESDQHCNTLKCPKCGGDMRREERPGPGQPGNALSGAPPAKQLPTPDEKTFLDYKDVRLAMWKAFIQHAEKYENAFRAAMHDYWKGQADDVINSLNGKGKMIVAEINGWSKDKKRRWLAEHKDKLRDLNINKEKQNEKLAQAVKPIYDKILAETAARRLSKLPQRKAQAQNRFRFNANDPAVEDWLGYRLETFSENVNGTTFQDINAAMRESFQEGEGVATIAKKLRDMFDGYDKGRANNIARTETIGASNFADLEAVRQTGLSFRKFWLNEPDARETHRQAGDDYDESGAIALDDEFKVGDDTMDAPGNGSLAEENCGCRCALAYVEAREEE